jgi:prepilin-type N-terminal cleavage/methylation domain-containing protein
MKRAAFTLIELLAVLAAVGLLAALAVPAMARALTKARVAKVLSDLGNVEVALEAYAGDHKGHYPPVTSSCQDADAAEDLQLPPDLAEGGYLPRREGAAMSTLLEDPFRAGSTYRYVAPEGFWQNGVLSPDSYAVWTPEDFPECRSGSGRAKRGAECPLAWAVWSAGPAGNGGKPVEDYRLPLREELWWGKGRSAGIVGRIRPKGAASFPTTAAR